MKDKWDLMQSWNLVLPPSRPTAKQLSSIRYQIRGIDRSFPVAVLGSTPEFLDLLHECGFQKIDVLEKNIAFHKGMSEIRIYPSYELLVEGDWLVTLPEHKGKYSLILSDLTSGNIPYDERGKFYRLITQALCKGGIFCDKVLTHSGQNLSVDGLIEKYSFLPFNLLYVNYFSCEMLFCSDLLDIKQLVDTSFFYTTIQRRVKNERVKAFAKQAEKITPPDCLWYYGRQWDELKDDYCPELELIAVEDDEESSPYYARLKFFTFLKRG
jgi:hypothetical protein